MAQDVLQPWTPTAQNFVQHQLALVTSFWQQGRQAAFCLDALPGGKAELKVTFQLPEASELIPPPLLLSTASKFPKVRPIIPLFSSTGPNMKFSAKKRKSVRRAVLHRAAQAAVSLPPPLPGSLREACLKVIRGTPLHPPITSTHLMSAPPTADNSASPLLPGATASEPVVCQPSTSKVTLAVSCQNCEQNMTPGHQCEPPPTCDPLPVCHYCCHKGSGDHPVHYFQQCLCDDSPCSCLCYCTGAQLEHKHRVFPKRFWGRTCDPANVPKAKAFAEERTERLRGYSPLCTSESCVKYMKEDGLCLS